MAEIVCEAPVTDCDNERVGVGGGEIAFDFVVPVVLSLLSKTMPMRINY